MSLASWSAAVAARNTRRAARSLKSWLAIARAQTRAAAHGERLAPGSLSRPDEGALDDPGFLLKQAELHGPVFKVWLDGKVTTCIFGLLLGRRFLSENENRIRAATTDLVPLFPHGTLRQMVGDPHREYRRVFVEAFQTMPLAGHEAAVREILVRLLNSLSAGEQAVGFEAIRALLKRGLTELLFRLILGIDRAWHGFDQLMECYERFAPNGIFVVVRPMHRDTYATMKSLLLTRANELRASSDFSSLLGRLVAADKLDETSIGNLIVMTEAGRFDMMGFWGWLIRMLGENREFLDQIAGMDDRGRRVALCEAVALEALRLEQSEFIFRVATSDILFDGHFIPKRSRIRIAVWESHKDPRNFAEPFRFDPQRFLGDKPSAEAYSPFGLDKHRCLGADWVIFLSSLFIEQLAFGLRWDTLADGAPQRGVFHFEPSKNLVVRFRRLNGGASPRAGR
jgi:cytochrome P450